MSRAVNTEPRMGASILRLFFHDCFIQGCDALIILDDTTTFTGEKTTVGNQNSSRGFDVIDTIKSNVEAACNATVSCADILAFVARDGVVALGGPTWRVPLGRRDARTASLSTVNNQLPNPASNLSILLSDFFAKGLDARDMTVLSGGHTIGKWTNTVVTTTDAFQVIEASKLAGVSHVAIIYDSKSNSSPSSNSVLDGISSFFGNLFSRQTQQLAITEFIQKLVETDVSYTLIKTNLTEDFSEESSYNVVVSAEGTYGANDLKVSKSQIASLVAGVFSNTAVAENKVVEVSTDPSAPSKPVDQLFSAIPEDGRRRAYAEEIARAKAEEEAIIASEKAREAAEMAKKLEEEVKKLSELEAKASSLAQDAKTKAEAAGASVENLLNKAKNMSSEFSWKDFSSQISASIQKPIPVPKVQIATIRGETKARKLPAQKAVVKQATTKPTPKPKSEPEKEVRKVFGGLFKQETIYMDD